MVIRPRAIVLLACVAAVVVFAIVQDRVTAAGARQYVRVQRAALAGRGTPVPVDEIMRPAVARSVRLGLTWGGAVLAAGLGIAASTSRRARHE